MPATPFVLYGLFRGTFCCGTSLDRPICYRPLRSSYPKVLQIVRSFPPACTKKLNCFYKEARLFLQRSSTISTMKLDYFYVEAQLFLRRCSTNCLKDLYKSSAIFWFWTIQLRSKRLPFGAMRIGNDLEMSGVL